MSPYGQSLISKQWFLFYCLGLNKQRTKIIVLLVKFGHMDSYLRTSIGERMWQNI